MAWLLVAIAVFLIIGLVYWVYKRETDFEGYTRRRDAAVEKMLGVS